MYNEGETIVVNEIHCVYVTDVTDQGVIVSSWGSPYLIKYEDMEKQNDASIYFVEEVKK